MKIGEIANDAVGRIANPSLEQGRISNPSYKECKLFSAGS